MRLQPNSVSSSVAERMEAINARVAVQSLRTRIVAPHRLMPPLTRRRGAVELLAQ
jgi:hypothetical protein